MKDFSNLNDHEIDTYIYQNLLQAPTEEKANEFLRITKRLCEIHQTPYWNHSVCHFIEKYGDSERSYPSLLTFLGDPEGSKYPQYRQALDLLIEHVFNDTNCLERIMCPIADFNINEALKHPKVAEFAYSSLVFQDPKNLTLANSTGPVLCIIRYTLRVSLQVSFLKKFLWEKAKQEGIPLFSAYNIEAYLKLPWTDTEVIEYLDRAYGPNMPNMVDYLEKN